MLIAMVIIFVLGYVAIATEHSIKIDKAASALLIGVLTWTVFILAPEDLISSIEGYISWVPLEGEKDGQHWILHELSHHLSDISEILFFLLGAMTIVELIDAHEGFRIITDRISTTNKVKLMWVVALITFFFSAALDNLTTSIVMISLLRKLIGDQKDRWFFAGMVVIAANAGGAWSPIGDVTTTMLWIGGQVTASGIVKTLFLPSLACLIAPLIIISFTLKGNVTRPVDVKESAHESNPTTTGQRNVVFFLGLALLINVPIFKTITHLKPYMGILLGLGILWVVTEIMHRSKNHEERSQLSVLGVLRKIDTASVLFFLGILLAIHSLQSAGHLALAAGFLRDQLGNMYVINIAIGLLSAIVDNVPLVAASMGMYSKETEQSIAAMSDPAAQEWARYFIEDGKFWKFLAYCAGTGGSALIIGSAAGVAVMGMERIDFIWYMKKISLLAIVGYLAGAAVYILMY